MSKDLKNADFYRITLHYACYGIFVKNGIVIESPPIAKWMIGESLTKIRKFVCIKGGEIEDIEVKEEEEYV